jgi:2-C-methyl-D-erythritol 2,4-cyclodiphosphate synthase
MEEKGYRLINLDTVVIAQVPRIAPYVEEMRTRLAAGLKATLDEVNVKGTSPEGLGSLGRKDGIAAESIVLLGRI